MWFDIHLLVTLLALAVIALSVLVGVFINYPDTLLDKVTTYTAASATILFAIGLAGLPIHRIVLVTT